MRSLGTPERPDLGTESQVLHTEHGPLTPDEQETKDEVDLPEMRTNPSLGSVSRRRGTGVGDDDDRKVSPSSRARITPCDIVSHQKLIKR